ncbi:MAG TPA: GIY-YIG nuclease family protein [Planctomycetota bacterium]|nr:GIY-YIG nuclease family protein [Planctomycetota bacterium]
MDEYYVYVLIDPRNNEEFYYGKGKGSRKDMHKWDESDSEKAQRIAAIHKAKLEPIVRVIACELSEEYALLVEKTLLWKLGRNLTNQATGSYARHFRPHYTLHTELPRFDFQCGLYYYNVGEGPTRNWDDYVKYGFISAGQQVRFRDAMLGFKEGDIIAAYFKRKGFVGIGKIIARAKPIRDVILNGKPLLDHKLRATGMKSNKDSDEKCEYVATVKWLRKVDRAKAHFKKRAGIYTTTHVRASLNGQPETKAFLNDKFEIDIDEYLI